MGIFFSICKIAMLFLLNRMAQSHHMDFPKVTTMIWNAHGLFRDTKDKSLNYILQLQTCNHLAGLFLKQQEIWKIEIIKLSFLTLVMTFFVSMMVVLNHLKGQVHTVEIHPHKEISPLLAINFWSEFEQVIMDLTEEDFKLNLTHQVSFDH